jgi:hypothetical protein
MTKFCAVAPHIFCTLKAVIFLYIQYVYQFMCIKQKAPGNRLFQKSPQNCGSLSMELASCYPSCMENFELAPRFLKICQHMSRTFHTPHLYRVVEKSLYNKQCVSHTDDRPKLPADGSHTRIIFNTVATPLLSLYTVVCTVLCKLKIILGAYCAGVH